MKRLLWLVMVLVVALAEARAFGISMDQAKPGEGANAAPAMGGPGAGPHSGMGANPAVGDMGPFERKDFEKGVDLSEFRLLCVQHLDQVKILDSWARQSIEAIAHGQSLEGQDPLYTVMDMAVRPEVWADRNIIYVQAIPIREQLVGLAADRVEGERMMRTGLMSPNFIGRKEVLERLQQIQLDTRLAPSVNKVFGAWQTFENVVDSFRVVPPVKEKRGMPWGHPDQLLGNLGASGEQALGVTTLPKFEPVEGYSKEDALRIVLATKQLLAGWSDGDVGMVNVGMKSLCAILPRVDAEGYPSELKREVELWYNRTFYGTIVNVFLYFTSLTLFVLFAIGGVKWAGKPAIQVFAVAVGLHVLAMSVRWWLAGRIPIQNQFESVLGSAMLGCVAGLILELWKRKGFFGLAFSFVGFLAMTACMSAPYVFGRDIGGAISKVAGILTTTYWLYIHVNIVIWSYALISASFAIGAVYLLLRLWHWVNPVEAGFDEAESTKHDTPNDDGGIAGSTPAANLAVMPVGVKVIERERASLLESLDQANMVVLQMAFWFLGTGIICGAIWADASWGRPWGWDPKETFALVTWIVYLIIVHARFVVKSKADATAWMAVAGFGVMMFNWIGVNFFLAGLHSYA